MDFVESAVFMRGYGRFAGEYVAACANSECSYLGQCYSGGSCHHVELTINSLDGTTAWSNWASYFTLSAPG